MKPTRPAILACLILTLLGAQGAAAEDFPPITDSERALTSVPGEPNAPAVVLFKRGEFLMAGYGLRSGLSSSLRIQVRLKILTEEGKSNGEVAITHSGWERLHGFAGRTVLPDGRILPVPSDARFVRKTSRSNRTFTTALAFPAVQVGAILDYQYELWFDTIFYLEPWYFSEEIPVRYSEIVFKTPLEVGASAWSRGPAQVKIQRQTDRNASGFLSKAWAENVPAVADDEKVTVTWALAQRADEALGDEATIAPSAPLGPRAQPFVQPVASRRTGVYFDYPNREEVELRLRWPEGWKLEAMPQAKNLASSVGGLSTAVEVKPGERALVYTRRMDITQRSLETAQQYEAIRSLFGEMEKSDAQSLLLARQ